MSMKCSTEYVYACDRCAAETKTNDAHQLSSGWTAMARNCAPSIHLCDTCTSAFKTWLIGNGGLHTK